MSKLPNHGMYTSKYKETHKSTKGTLLEIDENTLSHDRYKVLKIADADVSSQNYTVHKDYITPTSYHTYIPSQTITNKERLLLIEKTKPRFKDREAKEYFKLDEYYIALEETSPNHGITFQWAKIFDSTSSDNGSIFTNFLEYFEQSIPPQELTLSPLHKELFEAIDKDHNGMLEYPLEIKNAAKDKDIKRLTSHYIVQHASEWGDTLQTLWDAMQTHLDTLVEQAQTEEAKEQHRANAEHMKNQRTRAQKLKFFSACSSIENFPSSDIVYFLHPIRVIGEMESSQLITKEMLNAICPNAGSNQELLNALNKYCPQYQINTPLRIAHFLAQAATESGCFTKFVEDGTYRESIAIENSCYSAYRATPTGSNTQLTSKKDRHGNPQRDSNGNIIYNCKQPEYFNCKYGGKQGNTKIVPNDPTKKYYYQINDGYTYRGRGLIQITFRDTYKNFTTRYNAKNPDDIKDFEANPELVEQIKYAVASACDYWMNKSNPKLGKNLNSLADEGGGDEVVLKISGTVNGYWKLNADEFTHLNASDKTLYIKANDNLYIRTPNGYKERLEKFHKLKQHMGL